MEILTQLENIITATVPALPAAILVLAIRAVEIWFRFRKPKNEKPNV